MLLDCGGWGIIFWFEEWVGWRRVALEESGLVMSGRRECGAGLDKGAMIVTLEYHVFTREF